MIDRKNTDSKHQSELSQADKAFDESMVSLVAWLQAARGFRLLSREDVERIFKEELKSRRDHDCSPESRS